MVANVWCPGEGEVRRVEKAAITCSGCGRPIVDYQMAMVSWKEDENSLGGFKIRHKGACDARDDSWLELFDLTYPEGYIDFVRRLIEKWLRGKSLRDDTVLNVLFALAPLACRELTDEEREHWSARVHFLRDSPG